MKRALASILLLAALLAAPALHAQTGNIDPAERHAWAENAGWMDFRPSFGGVTVLPTHLTGWAWQESAGWVKLGSSAGGPYANTTATNWGVNLNTVTGALSGYAWSENAGWIRMDPSYGGVTYDGLTKKLSGWAWSESLGWLHFRSTTPTAYGVAVTCGTLIGAVSGGGAICPGSSSTVTVTVSGGAAPYTVTLDNGGGTQSGAGPAFTFTVSPSSTTTYSVASLVDGLSCAGSGSGSATVTVNTAPATPTASSNSPVCTGSTISLSTPTVAGATYAWTGPNGFTSTAQNPTIPNATTAMAGTYSVTVTGSGCVSGAGTVNVVVNDVPATPTAGNGGAVCSGGTISLTASTVAGATYAWTGPNGFTSTAQNPTIPNATTAMAGTYSVTATVNGCPSPAGTTSVVVNATPATPTAASNSPVCSGSTITLTTPAVAGATYAWTGPNGFTSTAQNPTIPNATAAMAGTYSVTATVNGCTSPAGTTAVVVNATPATPTAASNSPVCTGSTISLTTPTVSGATYSWTGPNGFTSTAQNPTIPNATGAMAGTYSVTVTGGSCVSGSGTTAVVVNAVPATPTAASNSPVCLGSTITLTTPRVAGATYAWTGPNGFTSTAQNPTLPTATAAMAGTYSVTVTTNGCTSPAGTTVVSTKAAPARPGVCANSPVCEGDSINLSTPALAGATYAWTGPNGFTSSLQNPTLSNATAAMGGTYSLRVTVDGCASPAATVGVTISACPADQALEVAKAGSGTGTVSSSPPGIVCGATCTALFAHGTAVTLYATPDPGSAFTGWSGGGCTGTAPCAVAMTAAQLVTATFEPAPVTPTITSFTVTPSVLPNAGTATLAWATQGAASVSIAGLSGSFALTGTRTVSVGATTEYVLTAQGATGSAAARATVNVLPAPGNTLGTPAITAPAAGQVVSVAGVSFTWGAVAGAAGYDVRLFDSATGATSFAGSLSGGSSTSTLMTLPNGAYVFAVRACAATFSNATCGRFATRAFSVGQTAPTAAPTVTFPAEGAVLGASTQTLSWTSVPKADPSLDLTYEVLLTDVAAGGRSELQINVPDPTLSTIYTLHSSSSYQLEVRACQAGCGPWSDPVGFSVALPPVPTAAPCLPVCAVTGGNSLTCTWSSVPDADVYRVYVVQPTGGPGGGALTVAARQISTTSVTLPVPVGAANVIVAACNGDGCGPWSRDVAINPPGPSPSSPNLGTPLAASVVNGPGVEFSWNRIPGDDGTNTWYRLYVQDLSRQSSALDVYTLDNFYAAYFKAEGARYDALVVGNPGLPAEVVGPPVGFNVRGTSATAPTMVSPAHQSRVPAGNLQLGWSPVPGATLYQYYVAVLGQGSATVTGVTPGLVVQVPLPAVAGAETTYSGITRACMSQNGCTATSDAGWGPWSNEPGGPGVTNFTVVP